MTSILTNPGALVALQTLQSTNKNLQMAQNEISTGLKVATAKDNSAIWAISKVMESDVAGFKAISESLGLGESTVAVARSAAESVTDLLTQMKAKIIAADGDNVDRTKLQADIAALSGQIDSVVGAAQFNGLNLVNGSTASTTLLSSLDRDATGNVSTGSITVNGQDLSTGGYTAAAAFAGSDGASSGDDAFAFAMDGTIAVGGASVIEIDSTVLSAGDKLTVTVGDQSFSYTATAADLAATTSDEIVATAIRQGIEDLNIDGLYTNYDSGTATNQIFVYGTDGGTGPDLAQPLNITGTYQNAGSGGLGALGSLDVSTPGGATAAVNTIEGLIQTSIDAAAAFGSIQGRIETQMDFVTDLTNSFEIGVGSLVDANMEEASARLQALQTQQQLGIQSLSIANQAPQSILALFR